jgi:hypothetical protein
MLDDRQMLQEGPPALLRFPETVLGVVPFGDVQHHALVHQVARLVPNRVRLIAEPAPAAIGGLHPVLVDEARAAGHRVPPPVDDTRSVVGVDMAVPRRGVFHPLARRVAEDVLDLRADVGHGERLGGP